MRECSREVRLAAAGVELALIVFLVIERVAAVGTNAHLRGKMLRSVRDSKFAPYILLAAAVAAGLALFMLIKMAGGLMWLLLFSCISAIVGAACTQVAGMLTITVIDANMRAVGKLQDNMQLLRTILSFLFGFVMTMALLNWSFALAMFGFGIAASTAAWVVFVLRVEMITLNKVFTA